MKHHTSGHTNSLCYDMYVPISNCDEINNNIEPSVNITKKLPLNCDA